MVALSIHPATVEFRMPDQKLSLEEASDFVFAFPESGPGQVLKGSKSTAISCGPRTIESAFALRQLHCFLMAESISLGKAEVPENLVKRRTFVVERNSRYAIALEFRHPRVIGASGIALVEVSPADPG